MSDSGIAAHVQRVRDHAAHLLAQLQPDPALATPFLAALRDLERAVAAPTAGPPADHPVPANGVPAPPSARPPCDGADDRSQQLERVLYDAPIGICLLADAVHRYVFTNPLYDQIVGRTQLVGKTVRELFPELAGQGIYELLDQVYQTGQPFTTPEILIQVDRRGTGIPEAIYYALTYQPVRNTAGSITGVVAYVMDVSDRRQLEQEQRRVLELMGAAQTVAETERQRLLTVLHQAPAAICTLEGPEHVFTFANPRYDQLIGRTTPLGMSVRTVLPEVEGQGFFELLDTVYRTGVPFSGAEHRILLDRQGTGERTPAFVNFLYTPLRDAQAQITGIFVHALDVTDLVTARQTAEAAVVVRDHFLSIAAHELKTPLTSLLGYIQLLQRRLRRAEAIDDRTDRVLTLLGGQAQRLTRLIDTLLDVARINMGHLAIDAIPVDLGALTRRVVDEVRITAEQREIILTLPEGPCMLIGDSLRLEQVLVNLLQNALKYSPEGGPVAVSVTGDAAHASVMVRDTGVGIPAAALPHLFDRFYRVQTTPGSLQPGMGIGLSVVQDIVTLHGGRIQVDSTEGVGSTFTVILPREPATGAHPVALPTV